MLRIESWVRLEKLKELGFRKMKCINSYVLFGTDNIHKYNFIKASVEIKTRAVWIDMRYEKEVMRLLKDL